MDYDNIKVKQAGEVVQSFISISKTLIKFSIKNATSLGITLQQMGILNTINPSPEITLKEVADKLQLPKSTVSVNVDGLVKLGLVKRRTTGEDRREIHLSLSTKGQELSRKSSQNALSYRAMILALEKIPEEDVQVILRTHKELLIHLQDSYMNG
ncbi:MAG TPA: MarR family winged helix-turn-helix transcriptional regulator [Desulfosporosinus sp.]